MKKLQELSKGDYIYYIEQNSKNPVICKEKIIEITSDVDKDSGKIVLCPRTKSFNLKTKWLCFSFGIMITKTCSERTHCSNIYNGSRDYYYNTSDHYIFGTSEEIVKLKFNQYMDYKIKQTQKIIDDFNNKKFNILEK